MWTGTCTRSSGANLPHTAQLFVQQGDRMRVKTLLTAILSLLFLVSGAKAQLQPKLVVRTSDGQVVGYGGIVQMGSVPANTLITKSFYIYNEGAQPLVLGAPPVHTYSPFYIAVPPSTSIINPAFNTGFT